MPNLSPSALPEGLPTHVHDAGLAAPLYGPVTIWTDGSCRPNPGAGGHAAIILHPDGIEQVVSGAEPDTTNNRQEMMAAIRALESLPGPAQVTVFADSDYLLLGARSRAKRWLRNGGPFKNEDLWVRLLEAARPHKIAWSWITQAGDVKTHKRAHLAANAARVAGAT